MSKQKQPPASDRSYTSVEQLPGHATSAQKLPGYAATPIGDQGNTVEAKVREVDAAVTDIKTRRGW